MKKETFIFLVLICLPIITASSSYTDFGTIGCEVDGDTFAVGSCSADKTYYCLSYDEPVDVSTTSNVCNGSIPVCCNTITSSCRTAHSDEDFEGYRCIQRTDNCVDYTNNITCVENSCYWVNNECQSPSDTCPDYITKESCEEDAFGAAINTCPVKFFDFGGVSYTISEDSCFCVWDSGDDNCKLESGISPSVDDGTGISYTCTSSRQEGECNEDTNLKDYNWTAISSPSGAPEGLLAAAGCVNSTGTIQCGQPIIELPGFSYFSIVLITLMLSLLYIYRYNGK